MRLKNFSDLHPSSTPEAKISGIETGRMNLKIPAGARGQYRLAQLDDTRGLGRGQLPWNAPLSFRIRARASHASIPGTWGFGLWNVPLSFNLGFGVRRSLPALPNAVWYFFSSPENYLTLDNSLPPHGNTAAVFRAPRWPFWVLAPAALAVPLLAFRPAARLLRKAAHRIVRQDAAPLNIDPTKWHNYAFDWLPDEVVFTIDEGEKFRSRISPGGPLGLVLWVDNQYMAFPPDGKLRFGTLENGSENWIELEDLEIN